MELKRTAIYIRVSTQEQADKGYSVEIQLEKLKTYAKLHNLKITNTYIDAGVSGAKYERPELDKLKENIENIDIVLIYKLDRLSRSMKDTMVLIEDIFKTNNVRLISLLENFDTASAMGMATVGMLSTFAQLERETIKERMVAGKVQSVKNGNYINQAPFGYISKKQKLYKDPKTKHILEYIFKRLLEDVSISKISQELKEFDNFGYNPRWYFYTISRIYDNKVYCGHTLLMKTLAYNTHEGYITDEQQKIIIEKIKSRTNVRSLNNKQITPTLFRGLIKCVNCDNRLSVQLKGDHTRTTYRCAKCKLNKISSPNIREVVIEEALLEFIKNTQLNLKRTKIKIKEKDFSKDYKKIDDKTEKIKKAWFNSLINDADLEKFNKEIEKEKKALIKKEKEHKKKIKIQNEENTINETLSNFLEIYSSLDYKSKSELLKKIIDKIELNIFKEKHNVKCCVKAISYKYH